MFKFPIKGDSCLVQIYDLKKSGYIPIRCVYKGPIWGFSPFGLTFESPSHFFDVLDWQDASDTLKTNSEGEVIRKIKILKKDFPVRVQLY